MKKEQQLWRFIARRLSCDEDVMLLVVAESSGSSPGRQGYKMAVAADGQLFGSIGGGVMEVDLTNQSRTILSEPGAIATGFSRDQIHRKDVANASGMICSGKQTVIFKLLSREDAAAVESIAGALQNHQQNTLLIRPNELGLRSYGPGTPDFKFEKLTEHDFVFEEKLGHKNDLYIIGGGHCTLALSEIMSKLEFHVSIFDDRPDLNTIQKNEFADRIDIVESYDRIAEHIPSSPSAYVVVMTLGFKSDAVVIRSLIEKEFKYFGVLGSRAKMATMMKELRSEGLRAKRLDLIRTPVGIPINSHTPEEIAVSIAAEIISVKNAKNA